MKEFALTQLSIINIRQDVIADFNIVAAPNNRFTFRGSTSQLYTADLILETLSNSSYPYRLAELEVPTKRVLEKILDKFDMRKIYTSSNVLEKQSLSLDALHSAPFSDKPTPPTVVQADWCPRTLIRGEQHLLLLTSYGACAIYAKGPLDRVWQRKRADLAKLLQSLVYETRKAPHLTTVAEYREFVGKHWITACAWDDRQFMAERQMNLVYVATELGEVIGFCVPDDELQSTTIYARYQSDLTNICYMKAFGNNFLVIASTQGKVSLLRVGHGLSGRICLTSELWRQHDLMPCVQVVVSAPNPKQFYLVMTKAAHIMVYCIDGYSGAIVGRKRTNVDAIKITGLAKLSENEFIISTLTAEFFQLTVSGEIELEVHEIDAKNIKMSGMEIKGISTTEHGNLMNVMLQHNRETSQKKGEEPTKAMLCQLYKTHDAMEKLSMCRYEPWDVLMDYAVELRLNVCNKVHLMKYVEFMRLSDCEFPNEFNWQFLQQLHLKYLICRSFDFYQRNQSQLPTFLASPDEMEFIESIIKLVSMILRLEHLATLSELSPFQLKAATCIMCSCEVVLNDMQQKIDANVDLASQIEKIRTIAMTNFEVQKVLFGTQDMSYITELCTFCEKPIDGKTLRCVDNHETFRCCISQLQTPLTTKRFCPQCNASALDSDHDLQQLLAPQEHIYCAYCRFAFTQP